MTDTPELPEELILRLQRLQLLRYGENPHQAAALYRNPLEPERPCVARARKAQGKELSYNNLLDADAAFECVAEFSEPAAVIVKHTNPCGAAIGATPHEAYTKALACDSVSAFGGIVALNRQIGREVAEEITLLFVEVVVAPDAAPDALEVFAKKPNVRVLLTGSMPDLKATTLAMRSISGGILVQERDNAVLEELKVVSKRAPTDEEMADLKFAFTIAKHVKSNAIVYAKDGATVGVGAGQMSRIDSTKIAGEKAGKRTAGSVMASDAFFPFPDVVVAAHEAGITAIIEPGGSKNDQASIDAVDKHGMAMVFTGVRHFRH
ncbi:hypothetical protein A3C21_03450 [Candidatus Kaiserbacteria bacterium RIFCSPHIGHO2_02_FULL_59_21]|uniref:Bifunctional purine biosynthesis protein PurH n=2 Tax=Candidatus Kaiseribacteriota TaxID=1752734 RepID=A0A0G1YX87_9BACT|nr:MAG: Bifunctional purine biosynthesis protein PurH [Candidatus Kaiserbacteria bacterium GW2011_GWA2_58_9]OGG61693.1 MAG: hypothetical protein A2766_03205 [Candidatus Kaiserbacteria bacterium RIFCSPHIGHO2_01_FULL_58_22]OGG66937.1 MAG: hypothetical protein A3C21_03450 [Candidatus Kaiserbacteria bacterium RIFCSPHIGHO2_02_FULL_59_21]OGG80450.1 MAG: hypothetical protein A2952_02610 [Candidatus Kaiserbacteria bacterium RIFCSPLOWO2_01_FULL_59_34]OGG86274.1 MAG: hypothetical protein A3I47_02540 [Can